MLTPPPNTFLPDEHPTEKVSHPPGASETPSPILYSRPVTRRPLRPLRPLRALRALGTRRAGDTGSTPLALGASRAGRACRACCAGWASDRAVEVGCGQGPVGHVAAGHRPVADVPATDGAVLDLLAADQGDGARCSAQADAQDEHREQDGGRVRCRVARPTSCVAVRSPPRGRDSTTGAPGWADLRCEV